MGGSCPPQEWCDNCGIPARKGQLSPHWMPLCSYVSMCGVLAGLGLAEPIYDETRAGLQLPHTIQMRALRFVVGLVVLLGMFFAVRAVEKNLVGTESSWSLPLRFLRYGQVPPVILLLAPVCFEALGV